jgi:hypothetical protein
MKQTQLEILLFTGTRFSSKQLVEKNDERPQNNLSKNDRLVEASWNGLFREALPELYGNSENDKKLFLWNVMQARHFLALDYAEMSQDSEKLLSMNPYNFMGAQLLS